MKPNHLIPTLIVFSLFLSVFSSGCAYKKEEPEEDIPEETVREESISVTVLSSLPKGQWQKEAIFPDRMPWIDDTLALNSQLYYQGYKDQGCIYLEISPFVKQVDIYVNSIKADLPSGERYLCLNTADVSRNGTNILQISSVTPEDLSDAIRVFIPYPEVIEGTLEEEGFRPETFELIGDIIESDIEYGFPSAQLAVISHGKLVYENTWGYLNRYSQNGEPLQDARKADNETMYDVASVTKLFAVNYALQKLLSEQKIRLSDKVADYLGPAFYEDVLDFTYQGGAQVPLETMQSWKASLTIKNLMKHEAGFPADPRYYNLYYDAVRQKYIPSEGNNLLYSGADHSRETMLKTIESFCKTPLLYEPGSRILYSDVDYMILGVIVEKVSGMDLDSYLKENFCTPLKLSRVTFNPLSHGFQKEDCAATELNGNTRDHAIDFPGIREYTLQGEVHDENAYYAMNGISGHAGLFANAADLAKLAFVMLDGGYGMHRFFTRNVIDTVSSPFDPQHTEFSVGWQRQGDEQRAWYFGPAASSTIGHQGWTMTLVMIDPQEDLIMVYLTNARNTPIYDKQTSTNSFAGVDYTASTLGFVPEIFQIGRGSDKDVTPQLVSLLRSMTKDAEQLIPANAAEDHPFLLNYRSKQNVLKKWEKKIQE